MLSESLFDANLTQLIFSKNKKCSDENNRQSIFLVPIVRNLSRKFDEAGKAGLRKLQVAGTGESACWLTDYRVRTPLGGALNAVFPAPDYARRSKPANQKNL